MSEKRIDVSEIEKNYLIDLISIIKDEAAQAMCEYNKISIKKIHDGINEVNKAYVSGCAQTYSRMISLMMQQATVFNIPLEDLGLDKIDPEKDLTPGAYSSWDV